MSVARCGWTQRNLYFAAGKMQTSQVTSSNKTPILFGMGVLLYVLIVFLVATATGNSYNISGITKSLLFNVWM